MLDDQGDDLCRDEFGAVFLQPFVNRGMIDLQLEVAHDGVLNSEVANVFRGIAEKKRFQATRAVRFPERDIQIILRAHEADDFQIGRKVLAKHGQRVGALAVDLVNFLRAQQLRLVRMAGDGFR